MITCKQMKTVIENILNARGLTEKFASGEFHLNIKNEPYMPLTIERHGNNVSVTHYYESNGDLIPDPDMEFVIVADTNWYPVGIQHSIGIYRRARWSDAGKDYIDSREATDQTRFSNTWAKNIKAQGFITAGL